MSNPTLPPVPASVSDPKTGPLTRAFGGEFLRLASEAQSILDKFRQVREVKSQLDSKLENGSTPEAIRYREIKAKAEDKLKAVKEDSKYEEDRRIIAELTAKIDEDIKARSVNYRNVVKEAKDAAVVAEIGEVVSDVDPAELAKQLTDINETLRGAKNMLQKENPELKGWSPVGVSTATGPTGDKGWKPRLAGAKVNGEDVTPTGDNVTTGDVAKVAGINEIEHLTTALQNQGCGGLRSLPTDKWTTFTVTVQDQPVEISVIGRANVKKDEQVAA